MQQGDQAKNQAKKGDHWLWLQTLQSGVRFFGIAGGGRNNFEKQGLEEEYMSLSTMHALVFWKRHFCTLYGILPNFSMTLSSEIGSGQRKNEFEKIFIRL